MAYKTEAVEHGFYDASSQSRAAQLAHIARN